MDSLNFWNISAYFWLSFMELHNYGHNKVPTIYEAFLGLCWGWLDYESNQELWWHKWHFLASRLTYLALKLHIHTLRLPKIRLKSNAFTRVGFLLSSFCNNQFAPRDPGFIVQILAGKNIFSTFCLFLNILFMRLFKDSSLGYSIIAN